MLAKMIRILKTARLLWGMGAPFTTVGELSRWTKIPKSTVRRHIEKASKLGLVHLEFNRYKTTGVWEIRLTSIGQELIESQKEMFQ